jgi:hypothetical protein
VASSVLSCFRLTEPRGIGSLPASARNDNFLVEDALGERGRLVGLFDFEARLTELERRALSMMTVLVQARTAPRYALRQAAITRRAFYAHTLSACALSRPKQPASSRHCSCTDDGGPKLRQGGEAAVMNYVAKCDATSIDGPQASVAESLPRRGSIESTA